MTADSQVLSSREEYAQRLEILRRHMRERGVDVLLIDEAEHLFSIAGWPASGSRYHAWVMPREVAYLRRAAAIGDEAMRLAPWQPRGSPVARGRHPAHGADPVRAQLQRPPTAAHGHRTAHGRPGADAPHAGADPGRAAGRHEAGAVARDAERIVRKQVLAAELRETYDYFTGYTFGYYGGAYMAPRTSDFPRACLPTADWSLEAGMVFHAYTAARGWPSAKRCSPPSRAPTG